MGDIPVFSSEFGSAPAFGLSPVRSRGESLQRQFRLVRFFLAVAIELPQIEVSVGDLFGCFSHREPRREGTNDFDRRGIRRRPRTIETSPVLTSGCVSLGPPPSPAVASLP